MGRIISEERKEQIRQARIDNPDALGPRLGELVVGGNIPIEAVAGLLKVSEPTIYRWMYGAAATRDIDKIAKITALLKALRSAKREKDLPLEGTFQERVARAVAVVKRHTLAG